MRKKIAVLGAGSWGTALAVTLGEKNHAVSIWDIDTQHILTLDRERKNEKYLPGISFHSGIELCTDIEKAMEDAEIVLCAAPAQHFRSALAQAKPHLKEGMILVNVAKGIEQKTLKRLSEIAAELVPGVKYVALSGPSHAEEVGRGMPTTVVAASCDPSLAELVQDVFMTKQFRVYTSTDIVGVELGGALKNIIALGAGISDGMGFGDNAKAALMTRGMAEITRLGVVLGAETLTFTGLTGVGDLIVTCTSMHSRNRRCGIMIGEGIPPSEATKRIGMVVEGMYTVEAAYELAQRHQVEMPITEQIYHVINETTDARAAVHHLMTRDKKPENDVLFSRNGTCK